MVAHLYYYDILDIILICHFKEDKLLQTNKMYLEVKMKKRMKKHSSIKTIGNKMIFVTTLLLIVPLLTTGIISYTIAKSELDKKGQILLKNSVRHAIDLIEIKQKEVELGLLPLEEAMEDVKVNLIGPKQSDGTRIINNDINLGKNGYFMVIDENGVELAHPNIEGQNLLEEVDKSGKGYKFVIDQINTAKEGGGFTYYTWNLPNSSDLEEKITYQEYDEGWGWIVVAGSYLNDYNEGANYILEVLIYIAIASTLLGMVIILLFSKHISRPISIIKGNLEELSRGNLTLKEIHIKNQDETGILANSFNAMLANLQTLIKTIHESARMVREYASLLSSNTGTTLEAINEVAVAMQDVSNAVTIEASNTDRAVEEIDKLANNINSLSETANTMYQTAHETQELNDNGLLTVDKLMDITHKNNLTSQEISDVIYKVSDSTQKINLITQTITQIASQTNLLALNASIEAARAGEAGKGFSVVAEEIRKLAEQSSHAVDEIKEIINGIQMYSDTSVKTMEIVKDGTREQNDAVIKTKESFVKISNSLKSLGLLVDKVDLSSKNMNEGKEQIVSLIKTISTTTEEINAQAEEVTASTEEEVSQVQEISGHADKLKQLAKNLTDTIKQFQI